jgi:hypothetical protein
MTGVGKKPALMASGEFRRALDRYSKMALLDALWCACQLGTDESSEEITTQAARNVLIALETRGDYIPNYLRKLAERHIDSDGDSNGRPECERSHGPNYRGRCDHA